MHHYCHLTEEEIKGLSLPKLRAYLDEVKTQIDYEIKLHGGEVAEQKEGTIGDIKNLFGWMNGKSMGKKKK